MKRLIVVLLALLACAGASGQTLPRLTSQPTAAAIATAINATPLTGRIAFTDQLVVGGSDPGADTVPLDSRLSSQNAWPGASTNITGGNLFLAGGMGVTKLAIADYTLLADTSVILTIDLMLPSSTTYTLIEGVHFSALTSNAVTAANLSAAVNAWCPGVTAVPSGASVLLAKTANTQTLLLTCPYGDIYGITNGTAGKVYLSTTVWAQADVHFSKDAYLHGSTMAPALDKQVNPSTSTLQADSKTVYNITGPAVGTITGGIDGRLILLRFKDAVGGVDLTAFTPAPGLGKYYATVGGWLALYYDADAASPYWTEVGRWPLPTPIISSGTDAPSSTPGKVGDVFVDTTNHKMYFAECATSSACWVIAN